MISKDLFNEVIVIIEDIDGDAEKEVGHIEAEGFN